MTANTDVRPDHCNGRPLWWALTMLLLSLAYLLPEFAFNAELVSVAGGKADSDEALRSVELFGRSISGIGVSLLLADLLIRGRMLRSKLHTVLAFTAILISVWPIVFFGQKWLIDHYLINPSSAEARQHAYYAQIVRAALIRNTVQIEGVPYDPKQNHTASEMTFLTLFSGMTLADQQLMQKVDRMKHAIAEQYVRQAAYQDFDQNYADYQSARQRLVALYDTYREGSREFNTALNGVDSRTRLYRQKMETDIEAGWHEYQQSSTAFFLQVQKRAEQVAPRIYDYFSRRNKCRNTTCLERLDKAYDRQIKQLGLGPIPPSYWLITQTRQIGVMEKAIGGVMTLGLSVIADALDGKDNDTITRRIFTNEVEHYRQRLLPKMEPEFIRSSGGYPPGIDSFSEFRGHTATAKRVRAKLRQEGLSLPETWRVTDNQTFNRAVADLIQREAQKQWRSSMARHQLSLPPNLSWHAFQQAPEIQQRIQQDMGGKVNVSPVSMDWNNREFLHRVVEPNITEETKALLRDLDAELPSFADGGALEQKGKQALRAAIVPPISMTLSLFLVIVTAIKLPAKGITLWAQRTRAEPDPKQRALKALTPALALVLIILVPLTLLGNRYTHEDSSVHYFLDQIEQDTSPFIAYALRWALKTQPLVHPVGERLNDALSITRVFQHNRGLFDLLDDYVLSGESSVMPKASEAITELSYTETPNQAVSSLLPLVIRTNAPNSRIRIMNIAPIYRPGMLLAPGRYDIEVSAPGYHTARRWITLTPTSTDFEFTLER